MICPFCAGSTRIFNSRSSHGKNQTWRRHKCKVCARSFTTKERIDWTGRIKIKAGDEIQPYNRERLLLSLASAGQNLSLPAGTLLELSDTIEQELQDNHFFNDELQEAEIITNTATTVLHRYDPNLALQYVNRVYSNKPPLELLKRLVGA